ncbi:MAG: hypothetical protein CFE21_03440 [Bacteroidetes bacterium B1(2017)]|nr:MAG: hypothetical protein CFE21_03440 [Bacteroidetes bacterium B1(2017)]
MKTTPLFLKFSIGFCFLFFAGCTKLDLNLPYNSSSCQRPDLFITLSDVPGFVKRTFLSSKTDTLVFVSSTGEEATAYYTYLSSCMKDIVQYKQVDWTTDCGAIMRNDHQLTRTYKQHFILPSIGEDFEISVCNGVDNYASLKQDSINYFTNSYISYDNPRQRDVITGSYGGIIWYSFNKNNTYNRQYYYLPSAYLGNKAYLDVYYITYSKGGVERRIYFTEKEHVISFCDYKGKVWAKK